MPTSNNITRSNHPAIDTSYQEIIAIERRWLSIKSHEIISELTQIQIFSEGLEEL
jgi:hypothetical protein